MINRFIGAALLSAAIPAYAIGTQPVAVAPAAQADGGGTSSNGGRSVLGGIFNCSADGEKQIIGAAAGGAVGGLLGNRIAGRGNRTLGTIIGGVLGAAAGSAVGCKLQKNDRDRAERATQAAIATGEDQSWSNPETGASGTVSVSDAAATGAALGDLRFAEGVEPAGGYSKVGAAYVSSGVVNVRGAPATTAPVRLKLTAGQRVWVPASVKGQPWLLVSDSGVAQGYVSAPLLTKAPTLAASCKMVKQDVSVPGEAAQTESYQACKDKTGAWVMTRV